MTLVAIYNPVCGDRSAKRFFDEHVLPYLEFHGKHVNETFATEYEGHAGIVLSKLLGSTNATDPITLILCSGDGTLHEIVNTVSSSSQIHLVIVPCGTANALFSSLFPPSTVDLQETTYRLQSLKSYIKGQIPRRLSFAITDVSGSTSVVSSVVTSTSLHAAILRDSECLRASHPGIERFKISAQKNSNKWYRGTALLRPIPSESAVQIYDPTLASFVQHPASAVIGGAPSTVEIKGPFAYFLSTINVDRLEPAFTITPLSRASPLPDSCDIIILRPMRDPTIFADTPDSRSNFRTKLWATLSAVYQSGSHIALKYNSEGQIVEGGNGPTVVEYIRCGGWQWIPDIEDDDSHLLCSDGAIVSIERGGSANCNISARTKRNTGFAVH